MNYILKYVGSGVLAATVSLHAGGLYFHHTLQLDEVQAYTSVLSGHEAMLHIDPASDGALISYIAMHARGINWL